MSSQTRKQIIRGGMQDKSELYDSTSEGEVAAALARYTSCVSVIHAERKSCSDNGGRVYTGGFRPESLVGVSVGRLGGGR